MSVIRAHQRYRLSDGTIVPGVTTILDSQLGWNKRVLMAWARREALDGNDPDKILDDTGGIGTVAHLLIEGFISGIEPDISDFTSKQIEMGCRAFESFKSWEAGKGLEYIYWEHQVISEAHRFGGTTDIIARCGDKLWLIDLKTSSGIYPEFIVQVAAYGKAYEEQEGGKIDEYHLLQLPRAGGGYQHHVISPEQIETAWEVFLHCRALYGLQGKLRHG